MPANRKKIPVEERHPLRTSPEEPSRLEPRKPFAPTAAAETKKPEAPRPVSSGSTASPRKPLGNLASGSAAAPAPRSRDVDPESRSAAIGQGTPLLGESEDLGSGGGARRLRRRHRFGCPLLFGEGRNARSRGPRRRSGKNGTRPGGFAVFPSGNLSSGVEARGCPTGPGLRAVRGHGTSHGSARGGRNATPGSNRSDRGRDRGEQAARRSRTGAGDGETASSGLGKRKNRGKNRFSESCGKRLFNN